MTIPGTVAVCGTGSGTFRNYFPAKEGVFPCSQKQADDVCQAGFHRAF